MKIVITGYNTCGQNKSGGVQNRIKEIYNRLQKKNVTIEYFCPMLTKLDDCDVLHLFKLDNEYIKLIKCAKKKGVKVVLSSIVPLTDGWKIDFKRILLRRLPFCVSYKIPFDILELVDQIIVETKQELIFIHKHYRIPYNKMRIIPNGIDPFDFKGDQIFEKIGKKKEYILQVGRVDRNKNVLNVIRAVKGTGIDYVIIGGCDFDNPEYYNQCKKEAEKEDNIHFLGWVASDSDLLKSAYAHAKVFVLASQQETFGMVVLEAASAGCNLALTKWLPIIDFKSFENCWLFDPNNIEEMRSQIVSAFKSNKNEITKKRVLMEFSWDKIIDSHISLYKELMQ